MPYTYNPKYYDGTTLKQLSPKLDAFETYPLSDGTILGLFQGNRGARPDIDFKIKVLFPGTDRRPEPPPHTYWVVDLLLKIPQYKNEVLGIVEFYINFYNSTSPFVDQAERNSYTLQTVEPILQKYGHISQPFTLSLDYVATVIELFSKNEKATPGAYMFRDLLTTLRDYINGTKHYTDVLHAAQPGFR